VWALPFLTALAPSERYARQRQRRHKSLTVWARPLVRQVHRWLPECRLVLVADSPYAALELLAAMRPMATVVTRLRLDAQLFGSAPPRRPHQKGRPRLVGHRLPTLEQRSTATSTAWASLRLSQWSGRQERAVEVVSDTAVWYHTGLPPVPIRWLLIRDPEDRFPTQALLCTDLSASPQQILAWFVQRWQLEVTFHAMRAHLGMETQRWNPSGSGHPWPSPARRRPPLGLFSLVILLAHPAMATQTIRPPPSAWYAKCAKPLPTVADALALVCRRLWAALLFPPSVANDDPETLLPINTQRWCDLRCCLRWPKSSYGQIGIRSQGAAAEQPDMCLPDMCLPGTRLMASPPAGPVRDLHGCRQRPGDALWATAPAAGEICGSLGVAVREPIFSGSRHTRD
jgi:hypothetical protein